MTRVAKIRVDEEVFREGARECLPFTTIAVKASKIDGNGAVWRKEIIGYEGWREDLV